MSQLIKDGSLFITGTNRDGSRWNEFVLPSKRGKGYPREDSTSGAEHPRQALTDPRLVLKWVTTSPREPFKPDSGVTDPRPVKPQEGRSLSDRLAQAASGLVKAEAKWMFIGRKPGGGVTDPAEPQGGRGDPGKSGIKPIQRFEVVDPPEAGAINAALARTQADLGKGVAPQTANVTAVAGTVHRLSTQSGQQGWVALKAGDRLGHGDALRLNRDSGGEVGFSSLDVARSQSYRKIHGGPSHDLYLLEISQ